LFAVSDSVAGQFSPDARIRVVHAGVSPPPVSTHPTGEHAWLRGGSPAILVLGSISRAKGTLIAVEAIAIVRPLLGGARLLIVGDGPSRILRVLHERIDRLGLSDCVRVAGFASQPGSLLQCSDIVLVPSRHEAYGLVTVEAMSAGIPVVGSATGGTRALLANGGGLLATVDDPRHFAAHIHAIATDPQLRDWLSERGRATASQLAPDAEAAAMYDEIERLCRATGYRGSKPAV
jgi:glycosyltransferase involved in cell wall biosynthesis